MEDKAIIFIIIQLFISISGLLIIHFNQNYLMGQMENHWNDFQAC